MVSLKSRANRIIRQRQRLRRDRLDARKEEIFSAFPRIAEIEKKLDATGVNLMNCVLDGSCEPEEAVIKIMQENRLANEEKKRILVSHGYSPDYIEDRAICEKCGDSGYINDRICPCVMAELNKELLSEANLSERLAGQTFASFRFDYYSDIPDPNLGVSPRKNITNVYNMCRSFAENFECTDKNLFFTGDCGLGKTFLSSAIANHLIEKGVDVLYISSNSLFPILEDMHFNREVSEKNQYLVRHVLDCELLILDDLGAEFITPFTSSELFRIINNRLLSERKTIISTNMDLNEVKKKYSERISSRISGCFEIVGFFGEDIRKKKKQEGN